MIFGTLANAERATQMPVLNYEHERARHAGYLAIKRALAEAYKTEFCDHAAAILAPGEETLKDLIPQLNVCMWEKKKSGLITPPSICLGYPRFMRELGDKVIVLDPYIHNTLKNFAGNNIVICYDNNLYIKETEEPIQEDVIALAVLYYMAHLQGKLKQMVDHIKKAIPIVFERKMYVPVPRAEYKVNEFLTEALTKQIIRNGQGVDVNVLYTEQERADANIREYENKLLTWKQKKNALMRDIARILDNPDLCPAQEAITAILEGLQDQVRDIKVVNRGDSKEIQLVMESFISDYDQKDFARQMENPRSTLRGFLSLNGGNPFRGIRADNEEYKKFITDLFKAIFVEEKLKWQVVNTLTLQLYPFSYSWKSHTDGESITGYTNPHLFWYVCWASAVSALAKCYDKHNYEQMPLYLKSALSQVTLGTDAALGYTPWEFYRGLVENNPTRAFIDKEGYAYTIRELFDLGLDAIGQKETK